MTVGESGEIVHKSKADFKRALQNTPDDKNTIARLFHYCLAQTHFEKAERR